MKPISDLLLARIQALGHPDVKTACHHLEVEYELFRKVISDGHVPKDKTLLKYAEVLGMDPALLILTAYWQKAPEGVKGLLEPVVKLVQDGTLKGER